MTLRLVLVLLVALLVPAASRADDRFDALRRRAEPVESLPGFLERFVGSCRGGFERQVCERNVQAARRSFTGKLLVATVSEGAAELMRAEARGDRFTILMTPFIDGGGYALTNGAPAQDREGRPRIGYVVLQGALPPGTGDLEFQSPFRTGHVELQVVFRAEGTWRLPRRGAGYYEGVRARFLGVRLVDARTGNEIASRVLGGA